MSDRDLHSRCLCGHLVFIHTDEDRTTIGEHGNEITEMAGSCGYSGCTCRAVVEKKAA